MDVVPDSYSSVLERPRVVDGNDDDGARRYRIEMEHHVLLAGEVRLFLEFQRV